MAGQARMKLSQDVEKITLPGEKVAFRLFGKSGLAILDLLQLPEEPEPEVGQKVILLVVYTEPRWNMINIEVLCRHPFEESKRAWVTPHRVEKLHKVVCGSIKFQQMRSPVIRFRVLRQYSGYYLPGVE